MRVLLLRTDLASTPSPSSHVLRAAQRAPLASRAELASTTIDTFQAMQGSIRLSRQNAITAANSGEEDTRREWKVRLMAQKLLSSHPIAARENDQKRGQ
ncbi:hypothetical protein [Boudabousia marimammalium]|uniref:Uncharacterized protein n=1 Tax=Boudabousia marimammalium TaxID=156892 RepID=A0A1Q5PR83_9ACTO|nr:hypothetical protein [Boudabousia marimammalium]OKL49910.1 hypothetical protein BM477_03110 [Boudabousia marimammalium]